MIASNYKITFPFGATTAPYTQSHPHMGDDRKMPVGTQIWVGGTLIGLSGGAKGVIGSGTSTGPHLHIQKYLNDIFLPTEGRGLDNTIAFPARVVEVGNKYDIGNFVRILDAHGIRWSYFHLSEIKVKQGQIILAKGESMPAVSATNKQIDDTINQMRLLAGIPDNQLNALLKDQRPLLRNNYVEGVMTVLGNYIQAPTSAVNKQQTESMGSDQDGEKWRQLKALNKELLTM